LNSQFAITTRSLPRAVSLALIVAALAILWPAAPHRLPAAAAQLNLPALGATFRENQRPGTAAWRSASLAREAVAPAGSAAQQQVWSDSPIRGYASTSSVNHGDPITFYVGTSYPSFTLDVYRMGWYDGDGARQYAHVENQTGQDQPVPAPDPDTGLLELHWQPSYTLQTGADWPSGVYLVKLLATNDVTNYIPFVVRADGQTAQIVYQVPFATYQAYNNWGGKSLYDWESMDGVAAVKVSFDRPYADWDGSGGFFDGDYNMIRWLERQGYDVTYVASQDLDAGTAQLARGKLFLSAFHDEYWSRAMREHLTAARDAGVSIAFFASDNIDWQIRFEPSSSGVARHVEVCYRKARLDPLAQTNPELTTVHWNERPLNEPTNALLGNMYAGEIGAVTGTWPEGADWAVVNSESWVYAGTGLQDGDHIPRLVGYEYDRAFDNGASPPGLLLLSDSVIGDNRANGTLYVAESGAIVFSAGTSYWPFELDDNEYRSYGADLRVQIMTANILNAMIAR